MDIVSWLTLGLALIVAFVGALLVAAWAILRVSIEDDWS